MGALAWLLRRRWSMAVWRENARLLLDRLEYVGSGAMLASARRVAAGDRAAALRRDSHSLWLLQRTRR
eukprot:6056978-Karenia_brevis.AAC.1